MLIDIVVISYTGGPLLEQAVESLFRFRNTADTRVIVQQAKQSIPKNVNAGFREVGTDWFVLFNDDWEALEDGWLDRMLSFTTLDEKMGFVSCRVVFDNGLLNHTGYFISENGIVGNIGRNRADEPLPDEYIKYAHPILINSSVFSALNGYDESFVGSQFADIDFVYRVAQKHRIFFAGSVSIMHHYNANKATNAVRERARERNQRLFRKKHKFKKRMGYLKKKNLSQRKRANG